MATINVRLFSYGDGKKYNGWWHRGGYLCDLVKAQRFDVFGAQEVKIKQMESMREMLSDYGSIGVGRDDGKEAGEFCPVFYRRSRLKMLDGGTFWLSETPEKASRGWDGACNRVCTWGYFQDKVTKAKFYFLNTHIENRGEMVAASKPTSYLSKRPHCLSDSTHVWDLIRRSWAVSLSTMKLSPHCLAAGYACVRPSEFDGLRYPGRDPRSISALHPEVALPDAAPKGISERTSYHPA